MRTILALLPLAALAALPTVAEASHGHRYAPPPPPEGRVVVDNRSGTTVTVTLPGASTTRLSPWQKATLYAPAGEATLRATYEQFGAAQLLETERVYVDPGRSRYVVIEPEHVARVMVTNDTPYDATLDVEDRYAAALRPHESRVVTVPVGDVELELHANGHELEEIHLDARPYAEHRWTVRREPTGTFVAYNPFDTRIEFVDARGNVRTAEPHARVVYADVPAGSFEIVARRVTDEPIDRECASVVPGRTVEWRPDVPREGFVRVENEHARGVRVMVDGRTAETLRPEEDARLELDVGWHRVAVRDEGGRVLLDTWVEVEPFDVARIRFGDSDYVAWDDRDRDHDDDHDRDREHRRAY